MQAPDKPTLLVYDNPAMLLEESVAMLREGGYRVLYAQTTDRSLITDPVGAVLTCAELPGGAHGKTFLQLRRQHEATPFLIISHVRSLSLVTDFFRAGVRDCLCAPFTPDALLTRLEACLESAPPPHVSPEPEDETLHAPEAHESADVIEVMAELTEDEPVVSPANTATTPEIRPAPAETDAPIQTAAVPTGLGNEAVEVVEYAPCGLLTFRHNELENANPHALRLLGCKTNEEAKERLNHPEAWVLQDAHGHELPADRWPVAQAVRDKSPRGMALGFERPDGTRVWVRMDATPVLRRGHVECVVVSLVNITDEMHETRKLRDRLAHR